MAKIKNIKNQINIGKMGKENTIANGDNVVATGKSVKTTNKKSIWDSIIGAIVAFFTGK